MASSEVTLKLLVDKTTNKVLFAEAGNDFVDLIFNILRLPVSSLVELVSANALGSVGRLYKSVADMGAAYLLPSADKSDLLQPQVLRQGADGRGLLARFKMYTCPVNCCLTVTVEANAECPECEDAMDTEMDLVLPPSAAQNGGGGYVTGHVTYMVTDGLEVTPLTSSITLINRFSVDKDVDLAEKIVAVGTDERLALIEAALRSDTVLSDVFLATKNKEVRGKTSDGCAEPLEPPRPVRSRIF